MKEVTKMLIQTLTQCRSPSDSLVKIWGGILMGLTLLLVSGWLNASLANSVLAFIVLFGLLGLVGTLKSLSIARCPTQVLTIAAGFAIVTAIVDLFLI